MKASELYSKEFYNQNDEEDDEGKPKSYFDRRSGLSPSSYHKRLDLSTTLYMGNLSFFT